jgi:hypothetical protein
MLDPSRVFARTLKALPSAMASMTETLVPKRANPKILMLEPNRITFLIEVADPQCT